MLAHLATNGRPLRGRGGGHRLRERRSGGEGVAGRHGLPAQSSGRTRGTCERRGEFGWLADARGSLAWDFLDFLVFGFLVGFIIVELDGVVDVTGIGGVEDGDGAAAFFGGVFGGVQGVDEFTEGVETGVGEFLGVGGHGGPPGECRVQRAEGTFGG
jgi:hypothetical protein